MNTNFQIRSFQEKEFIHLFNLDNAELEKRGIVRMKADKHPGFPCRISLEDAAVGEEVLLLTYQHHQTNSPYQAGGPVFVRKAARAVEWGMNEIPRMLVHRFLSLRGYDKNGMMKDALVSEGEHLKTQLNRLFENSEIDYVHIHNAKPGCYNCMAERVS